MKNSHLDRRTQYSIKRIRYAIFELLEKKDLNDITVTDVCNVADINRGTFYKYYRDVDDLFQKIGDNFITEIHQLMKEDNFAEIDLKNKLQDVLYIIHDNADLIQFIRKSNTANQLINRIMLFTQPYLRSLINSTNPDISEEDASYLSEYIIGGCTNVVAKWVKDQMTVPPEQIQKIMYDRIMDSLKTRL